MISHRNLATAVTAAAVAIASTPAQASDQYSFPSPSGALIAASASTFVQPTLAANPEANGLGPALGGSLATTGAGSMSVPPLPAASPDYRERFGMRPSSADAYGYRFLTHALGSGSFANYAADYYRLFAPGYAVSAWTDRVSGFVELGYGGAVDSWTAAAYYMPRVRGPHKNSEPDLTLMPKFRPHPELEQDPTFTNP